MYKRTLLIKTTYLLFLIALACSQPKKEPTAREKKIAERQQQRAALGPEEMGFKLQGQKFILNTQHTATERAVRDETGRRIMRLYLVQKDYRQSLDMLFPIPNADSLPKTYEFRDKHTLDKTETRYAVCLFSSYYKQGWHEVPASTSTITVTKWDKSLRIMSGTFELHIKNAEDASDVIDITEGYFNNVRFGNQ